MQKRTFSPRLLFGVLAIAACSPESRTVSTDVTIELTKERPTVTRVARLTGAGSEELWRLSMTLRRKGTERSSPTPRPGQECVPEAYDAKGNPTSYSCHAPGTRLPNVAVSVRSLQADRSQTELFASTLPGESLESEDHCFRVIEGKLVNEEAVRCGLIRAEADCVGTKDCARDFEVTFYLLDAQEKTFAVTAEGLVTSGVASDDDLRASIAIE